MTWWQAVLLFMVLAFVVMAFMNAIPPGEGE